MTKLTSPASKARLTGLVYLSYFMAAIAGQLFLKGIAVPGNAAATATNILTHASLFRLGIATSLLGTALYIALAALFYRLFKPVAPTLSLLAAFSNLTGAAIQAFGVVFQLGALAIVQDSPFLSVFSTEQLHALALLSLKMHSQADAVSLVFFGVYCLLLGYLVARSAFLPQLLGAPMILAGLGWLTFLSPSLARHLSPYVQIVGVLAEALLMLWLLFAGVNVPRWEEQARQA